MADCALLHDEGCEWCGNALKGKQKRWCSRKCHREFVANHRWTQAKNLLRREEAYYLCEGCGLFYGWDEVDVDHIEPCLGRHGQWGCHHHQANLRLLCKACHKENTRKQHRNGVLK